MTPARSTIVALSSGTGRAGVAVVRLSGPRARFAVETIAGAAPPPRIAKLSALRDRDGAVIDRGLVLMFPGPHSFTGEDLVEFQVHGSSAVLAKLISELTRIPGVRIAEPGEFTRRAFENGKLDLSAVEGLADLIDSETEWQRRQALRQMDGALGDATARWRELLVKASVRLEAEIDFSDEGDVGSGLTEEALGMIDQVRQSLEDALVGFERGERIRDGFVVVLSGPPNAGKSTLLNRLARRDVAIVSARPGTTRDAIEVRMDIGGAPVILIDTAGVRDDPSDEVEQEGMRRARMLADRADLVLSLRSPDDMPSAAPAGARVIAVATKADLGGLTADWELPVSAATGEGIDGLLMSIRERIEPASQERPLLTRERHRIAVKDAAAALLRASLHGPDGPSELIAEDMRVALRALARLVGAVDAETVLDSLFAGFCIGK